MGRKSDNGTSSVADSLSYSTPLAQCHSMSDLSTLLLKACEASPSKRRHRQSKGASVASLINTCSQTQPTKFLAWSSPDHLDDTWESVVRNSFLAHLSELSFVRPHPKLTFNYLKEEKQLLFSIKIFEDPSNLQVLVMERTQWTYIHQDIYSALASAGRSVPLPGKWEASLY